MINMSAEPGTVILILLIIKIISIWVFIIYIPKTLYWYYNKDKKCDCGLHKECVNKVNVTYDGRMFYKTKGFFQCGKVQQQVTKLKKHNL